MKIAPALPFLLPLLLSVCSLGAAAADPPSRVARLSDREGSVSLAAPGETEWLDAPGNRPLLAGERLWTDRGARAQLQLGSATARLDGLAQLEIAAVGDREAKLALRQGSLALRVRNLQEGESVEVDTPQLGWRVAYPGDFRLDVDPVHGTTRVTVLAGAGTAYGEDGSALPLGGGQQVVFRGRRLGVLATREAPPDDAFDRWVASRNRREDQSIAARHVPRELVGYQQLDDAGQWRQDKALGAVWLPAGLPQGWAPFRQGRWSWLAPWGWTWLDDAPWGFATSHYGRWAQVEGRWAWAPAAVSLRPVYAPAVVAFAASAPPAGAPPRGVAWFPLAPGEAWRPSYEASDAYLAAANPRAAPPAGPYAWQRRPDAVSFAQEGLADARPARAPAQVVASLSPRAAPAAPQLAGSPQQAVAVAFAKGAKAAEGANAPAVAPPQPGPALAAAPAASAAPAARALAAAAASAPSAAAPAPSSTAAALSVASAAPAAPATASAAAVAQSPRPAQARHVPPPESAARVAAAMGAGPAARTGRPTAARSSTARGTASVRRQARAQQLTQAQRAADRAAVSLRRQRQEEEALAAWQRHQQAVADQFRREQRAWEQRQQGIPVLRSGPAG